MLDLIIGKELTRTRNFYAIYIGAHTDQVQAWREEPSDPELQSERQEEVERALLEFGSIQRIAHAAVLIKAYQTVEYCLTQNRKVLFGCAAQDAYHTIAEAADAWKRRNSQDDVSLDPGLGGAFGEVYDVIRPLVRNEQTRGFLDFIKHIEMFRNSASEKVDVKALPHFGEIDMLRMLVNVFKHNNGRIFYGATRQPDPKHDVPILKHFNVNYEDENVNEEVFFVPYEDLNVREYVDHVEEFCKALNGRVGRFFEKTPVKPTV
jgi:hypothetical protein